MTRHQGITHEVMATDTNAGEFLDIIHKAAMHIRHLIVTRVEGDRHLADGAGSDC